jgi:pimeloyl-ACP methyl ester carboxylesterase
VAKRKPFHFRKEDLFMSKRLQGFMLFWVSAFLVIASTHLAHAAANEHLYLDVTLRSTGSAKIHAGVYKNPQPHHGVLTVLAVHGLTEVGSMYEPLIAAIYADPVLKHVVKRVIAIDMVGHGLSSFPTLPGSLKFGDLLIDDNISVLIQVIDRLRDQGKGPQVVIGHSMGGLAIQGAQEYLLSKGSSLAKLGVLSAVLMAAVPAYGAQWTQYPTSTPVTFVDDPVLGSIFSLPVYLCGMSGGFNTLTGALVPGTPSFETCTANGWMGPEPRNTLLQLVGALGAYGINRPYAREKAFEWKNGTALTVLGFSQDVLAPIVDQPGLYTYLTGIPSNHRLSRYHAVVAEDAVHSMFISNPTGLLSALRCGIR